MYPQRTNPQRTNPQRTIHQPATATHQHAPTRGQSRGITGNHGHSPEFAKISGKPRDFVSGNSGRPFDTTAPILQRTSPQLTNPQSTNLQRWFGGDHISQMFYNCTILYTHLTQLSNTNKFKHFYNTLQRSTKHDTYLHNHT
jgi:hypothetical protein